MKIEISRAALQTVGNLAKVISQHGKTVEKLSDKLSGIDKKLQIIIEAIEREQTK